MVVVLKNSETGEKKNHSKVYLINFLNGKIKIDMFDGSCTYVSSPWEFLAITSE